MPSPFPGFDPYLESRVHWRNFHQRFWTYFDDDLNSGMLPDEFISSLEERCYVNRTVHPIGPDIAVIRKPTQRPVSFSTNSEGYSGGIGFGFVGEGGGVAVLAPPELQVEASVADIPMRLTLILEDIRETFLEIRAFPGVLGREEKVVAVIEMLSPTNKSRQSDGNEFYLKKQKELLRSEMHLLELDFLRGGAHTVAIPISALPEETNYHGLVCLHRWQRGGAEFDVWPTTVQKRLPRVTLPLADGFADVVVDLQGIFARAYDNGPYRKRIDYRLEREEPFTNPDDARYLNDLLTESGHRTPQSSPVPVHEQRKRLMEPTTNMYRFDRTAPVVPSPDALTDADIARYHADGFLAVENVLSATEVESAKAALADLIHGRTVAPENLLQPEPEFKAIWPTLNPDERADLVRKVYLFVQYSPTLNALAVNHVDITQILQKLLGEPSRLIQDMALLKPPHIGIEKPWHQDAAYFAFDKPLQIAGVWIALDAATAENGCMHAVPGTHLLGPTAHTHARDCQIPDQNVDVARDMMVPLAPGGAMFFSALVHHGTPPNNSDKRRWALQYHYAGDSCQPISTRQHADLYFAGDLYAGCKSGTGKPIADLKG